MKFLQKIKEMSKSKQALLNAFILQCVTMFASIFPIIKVKGKTWAGTVTESVSLVQGEWIFFFLAALAVTICTGVAVFKQIKGEKIVALCAKIVFIVNLVMLIIMFFDAKEYAEMESGSYGKISVNLTVFGWFYIIGAAATIFYLFFYSAKVKQESQVVVEQPANEAACAQAPEQKMEKTALELRTNCT